MIALLLGLAVFLISLAVRRPSTSVLIAPLLGNQSVVAPIRRAVFPYWLMPWVGVGGAIGSLLLPLPWVTGLFVGSTMGAVGGIAARRRFAERRRQRLGFELPAIADLLALYVLAGESVEGAIRQVCSEASGVAVSELLAAIDELEAGTGLVGAVRGAASRTAHPDAARLYELLAQAHQSGARLVDALEIFAGDRRSSIGRDMAEEGGRRALIGYGPILGLMIPTTLAFLIFPTLAGLDALVTAP